MFVVLQGKRPPGGATEGVPRVRASLDDTPGKTSLPTSSKDQSGVVKLQ